MKRNEPPRIYLPGQPTSREAERIALVEFLRPLLSVRGTVVTYTAMGDVIKIDPLSERGIFFGVLNAARKELHREDGIPTECAPTVGVRSKHDSEMVQHGIKKQREAGTKFRRAVEGLSTIRPDEVAPEYLRVADSQRAAIAKLIQSTQMARRTAQAELKGREAAPRIEAPSEKHIAPVAAGAPKGKGDLR